MATRTERKHRLDYNHIWSTITTGKHWRLRSSPCPNSETEANDEKVEQSARKHIEGQLEPKKRPLAALRRRSSKIFSGLRSQPGGRSTLLSPLSNGSTHNLARDVAAFLALDREDENSITPGRNRTGGPFNTHPSHDGHFTTQSAPPNLTPKRLQNENSNHYSTSEVSNISDRSSMSSKLAALKMVRIRIKRRRERVLRESQSLPGFAHVLSNRLTNTFGITTIVHRPGLKCRPFVASFRYGQESTGKNQEPDTRTDGSTDLSNPYDSARASLQDRSTIATSAESMSTPRALAENAPVDVKSNPNISVAQKQARESALLSPIQESPVSMPNITIKTVESTASAKVFFETHFNSMLSGNATPRTLRRRALLRKLYLGHYNADQVREEHSKWAVLESAYLRNSRVSKSRHNRKAQKNEVSVAGYEVIRVLGKGSFGVVRLVRERKDDADVRTQPSLQARRDQRTSGSSTFSSFMMSLDGRNALGAVHEPNPNGEVYAMKVIRKASMLRNSQEAHLHAERDILVASEKSKWVVPLIESFQDSVNLYLVMEFMIGGDFLGLLIKYDKLEEKRAQWYVAEMVLCLEETHRLQCIHRDVKPDNFLISASGHLKISDFGLAFDGHWAHDQNYFHDHRYSLLARLGIKVVGDDEDQKESASTNVKHGMLSKLMENSGQRSGGTRLRPDFELLDPDQGLLEWYNSKGKRHLARSIVGTSQYMAPEVIRGREYDGRCDWWSIGIILYECLYGETPFIGKDRQTTKINILNHKTKLHFPLNRKLQWNHRVSREAKDLINRLLQDKEFRLSARQYMQNDCDMLCHTSNPSVPRNSSPDNLILEEFHKHFVFPNDATDIKAHPFFSSIDWQNHHLTRPPEVPDVRDRYDTKYFDQEPPVSDMFDGSSESDIARSHELHEKELRAQESFEQAIADSWKREYQPSQNQNQNTKPLLARLAPGGPPIKKASGGATRKDHDSITAEKENVGAKNAAKQPKQQAKKRPRDMILRDKQLAKEAMEIRKKGAFLGYTYRRPKAALAAFGRNFGNSDCEIPPPLPPRSRGRIPDFY